jgi:hypothetical protein
LDFIVRPRSDHLLLIASKRPARINVNCAQAPTAQAGHDINIGAATQATDHDLTAGNKRQWLSWAASAMQHQRRSTPAIGPTFSGNTVNAHWQ